jgi:hypothetical protein
VGAGNGLNSAHYLPGTGKVLAVEPDAVLRAPRPASSTARTSAGRGHRGAGKRPPVPRRLRLTRSCSHSCCAPSPPRTPARRSPPRPAPRRRAALLRTRRLRTPLDRTAAGHHHTRVDSAGRRLSSQSRHAKGIGASRLRRDRSRPIRLQPARTAPIITHIPGPRPPPMNRTPHTLTRARNHWSHTQIGTRRQHEMVHSGHRFSDRRHRKPCSGSRGRATGQLAVKRSSRHNQETNQRVNPHSKQHTGKIAGNRADDLHNGRQNTSAQGGEFRPQAPGRKAPPGTLHGQILVTRPHTGHVRTAKDRRSRPYAGQTMVRDTGIEPVTSTVSKKR